MPPPPPLASGLQQLLRLDRSSSEFSDWLDNALHGREYQKCVPNLQDDDLKWLVDYLDEVCRHVTFPTLHR